MERYPPLQFCNSKGANAAPTGQEAVRLVSQLGVDAGEATLRIAYNFNKDAVTTSLNRRLRLRFNKDVRPAIANSTLWQVLKDLKIFSEADSQLLKITNTLLVELRIVSLESPYEGARAIAVTENSENGSWGEIVMMHNIPQASANDPSVELAKVFGWGNVRFGSMSLNCRATTKPDMTFDDVRQLAEQNPLHPYVLELQDLVRVFLYLRWAYPEDTLNRSSKKRNQLDMISRAFLYTFTTTGACDSQKVGNGKSMSQQYREILGDFRKTRRAGAFVISVVLLCNADGLKGISPVLEKTRDFMTQIAMDVDFQLFNTKRRTPWGAEGLKGREERKEVEGEGDEGKEGGEGGGGEGGGEEGDDENGETGEGEGDDEYGVAGEGEDEGVGGQCLDVVRKKLNTCQQDLALARQVNDMLVKTLTESITAVDEKLARAQKAAAEKLAAAESRAAAAAERAAAKRAAAERGAESKAHADKLKLQDIVKELVADLKAVREEANAAAEEVAENHIKQLARNASKVNEKSIAEKEIAASAKAELKAQLEAAQKELSQLKLSMVRRVCVLKYHLEKNAQEAAAQLAKVQAQLATELNARKDQIAKSSREAEQQQAAKETAAAATDSLKKNLDDRSKKLENEMAEQSALKTEVAELKSKLKQAKADAQEAAEATQRDLEVEQAARGATLHHLTIAQAAAQKSLRDLNLALEAAEATGRDLKDERAARGATLRDLTIAQAAAHKSLVKLETARNAKQIAVDGLKKQKTSSEVICGYLMTLLDQRETEVRVSLWFPSASKVQSSWN